MGDVRWYKRDPNAALAGFACLTLEECGAYNIILELIYIHDGELVDDDYYLAGWMRSDVRVWRRLRKRLLELEKLYLHAGKLRNKRADREVDAAQHRIASAAAAGMESQAKQKANRKFINDLKSTAVQRPFQQPTPTKNNTDTSTEIFTARVKGTFEEASAAKIARIRRFKGRA